MNTENIRYTFTVNQGRQFTRLLWALGMSIWLLMSTSSLMAVSSPPKDFNVAGYILTWGCIGALMFLLPAGILIRLLTNYAQARRKCLLIHDRGITINQFGTTTTYEWKDFSGFKQVIQPQSLFRMYMTWQIHLFRLDQPKIVLQDDYQYAQTLLTIVAMRITESQLNQFLDLHERGETITTGNLVISRQSITQGDQTILLQDIQDWQVTPTDVVLRRANGNIGMLINTTTLPNSAIVPLFLDAVIRYPKEPQ